MTEAIKLQKQIKSLSTTLMYSEGIKRKAVDVYTFSDASFNLAAGLRY